MTDHDACVRQRMAERYILGELAPADRAAFEAHYFACEECADEVRVGFELRENVRSIFAEEERKQRWRSWVPLAACIALLFVTGLQNFVVLPKLRKQIAGLHQAQVLAATVVAPASRGAAPDAEVSAARIFVPISLAVGAVPSAERYECELRSAAGKLLETIPAARMEPDSNLTLLIPSGEVAPGRYEVVVFAVNGRSRIPLEHYYFATRQQ